VLLYVLQIIRHASVLLSIAWCSTITHRNTSPTPALIFVIMKLRDRYPHLQNPAVVKAMVLESVYASMALENQTVSMERLDALYAQTEPAPAPTPTGAAAR